MGARLGQYCINVTDLDRSTQFYTEVMGLEIRQRVDIPEAREIILGGEGDATIQLAQEHARTTPVNHGDALSKLYVFTDNLQKAYDGALAFGCKSLMPPTELTEWKCIVAFIADPDGYKVELVQQL